MVATIYFAGGEDVDYSPSGSLLTVTTAGSFRSAWARCGLTFTGTAADPPTNRATSPTFTAVSSFWVHQQLWVGTSNATPTLNTQPLRLLDAGTCRLILRGTGVSGEVKISKRNAAGTITDLVTSSAAFLSGVLSPLDLFINYSTSGQIILYSGGVSIADTGTNVDVTTDGATTLNQMELSGFTTGGTGWVWSEGIVSDSDTRGKGLWLMNTSSAGNADQWTGTLANVNKNTINDATFISSGTAAQIQEYLIATAPSGGYNVDAVVMSARALVGVTGPQHFEFVTRLGGTDFTSSDRAPTTAFSNFNNYIQATNPNTTGVWALSDLTAAGVNYGVKSTA